MLLVYSQLLTSERTGTSCQRLFYADFDIGIPILDAQIKKEESTYKEQSQTRFKLYHFKPMLSLKTSLEQ